MKKDLLQKLIEWRNECAKKEGVEIYRVLSTQIIKEIAALKPKSREELIAIKGIKEKKFEQYGIEILSIVNGTNEKSEVLTEGELREIKPLSVGAYLLRLNFHLKEQSARITGEISSLDIRDNYLFFSLKDKNDKSLLNCFMWASAYKLSGVALEEGMEIIIEGFPEIYPASGRLSFKVASVELVGEGALKKAYDELKKKLEQEGIFAPLRKRALPHLPERIGVITSKDGAAIGDFLANIGKFGFSVSLLDCRVEGQFATSQLLQSLKIFRKMKNEIDVLVIMRGGGSLESLLPFNNETLVREIASFPIPVLAGIGHEKDISLVALAADRMFSTPTAVAKALNESWEEAQYKIEYYEQRMLANFEKSLFEKRERVNNSLNLMKNSFHSIFETFRQAERSLDKAFSLLHERLTQTKRNLVEYASTFFGSMRERMKELEQHFTNSQKLLTNYNPERQLKLGYSIARRGNTIIRSMNQIKESDEISITVNDGTFNSKVLKHNIHGRKR